jgi:tetratricopeptide (TPR) repeat protein
VTNHAPDKKIEGAFAREDWTGARNLIVAELKRTPDDHWLLARLSTTYYEQHRYADALKFIRAAFRLMPKCPLVLWDYAGTLDALGKSRQALKIYGKLIEQGPHCVGEENPCGEGLEWALSLLADCVFRAGACWERLDKRDKAVLWYEAFLKLRTQWSGGIHTPDDALQRIEKLSKDNPRRAKDQFSSISKELLGVDS